MRMALVATVLGLAMPAMAQDNPFGGTPEWQRTATWYADHPSVMQQVTRTCQNDPGHGKDAPDCINAEAGRTEYALRRQQRLGQVDYRTPPSNPRYFIIHPDELPYKLKMCQTLAPEWQTQNFCPSARQAAAQLARR